MATTATNTTTNTAITGLSLKLLIDRKAQRVLFAEASKDVVDFLFSFLALHVGSVVKLLGEESMVGSVGNLYASVDKLDAAYVLPGVAKDTLLRPTTLSPSVTTGTRSSLFRLPAPTPAPSSGASPKKFFRCNNGDRCNYYHEGGYCNRHASFHNYVSDTRGTTCPLCGGQMNTEVEFVLPAGSAPPPVEASSSAGCRNGFVQGIVMYTVLDNLTITPMSSISGITLLNTLAVTDLAAVQEKTVELGYDGLQILKASLHSKTVLTLRKKAAGSSGDA
ncbi:hypothetical protein QOZ80_1AG0010040 [Eleusine coracana subsp. coracana]|nr:hypothetical protein QOZ80_1AG0010040 [Eleusine coracana subsp. coracana]